MVEPARISPDSLPTPAVYFAPRRGRYDASPGMSPLGAPFGNGAADARLFQIDREFPRFRANKLACRAERMGKYVQRDDTRFAPATAAAVARLMAVRLATEYPDLFTLETLPGGAGTLECRLTGERLAFDTEMGLVEGGAAVTPPYADAFDALCCQVPEDVVVVTLPESGEEDANAALHVCAPSHWSPEEKAGASFVATHAPVPGFEKIARAAAPLLKALVHGRPMVRFNWGIEFTDRLNLHPEPPPGEDPAEWNRRTLRDADGPYLRVERQVLWGLPDVSAVLFTIRIYTRPFADLSPEERGLLRDALRTLSPEIRAYKSLEACSDAVLACLGDG